MRLQDGTLLDALNKKLKIADDATSRKSQKDPRNEGAAGYDDFVNFYIHSTTLESTVDTLFTI